MPSTTSSLVALERSIGVEVDFHSPLHEVIISLITTLGGYLQLQYQSHNKSPLEEHKKIMVAIYVNLFMYGMGLMAEFKLKTCGLRWLSIIKRFTPLFGILVVVLIMIILFPLLGFVAFILWTLITMEAVVKLFKEILQWLSPMFIRARNIATSYSCRIENGSPEIQEDGSTSVQENGSTSVQENEFLA